MAILAPLPVESDAESATGDASAIQAKQEPIDTPMKEENEGDEGEEAEDDDDEETYVRNI